MELVKEFELIVEYWEKQVQYWKNNPHTQGAKEELSWANEQLKKYYQMLQEVKKNEQAKK